MGYTQESIERVKDAIDMVDLVSQRTELRRVGSQLQGRCPFHDERSPSFSVDPVKKLYYCFGCGAKGDAIGFVRESQGLDFPNAVEWLADRYNVELQREAENPEAERRRARQAQLRSVLARTAGYYERLFWESDEAKVARDYLLGRGLSEEILKEFGVGYAPAEGDRVVRRALEAGLSRQDVAAAGLGQQTSRGFRDRFRGRVLFPLADHQGRVLGFAGRALRDEDKPKYLNTSDNDVFHKGRLLFGLHKAAQAITKSGRAIVVEGYTDVLGLHQAGFPETVAIMGTSLTEDQVTRLTRLTDRVLLALDADKAGQDATVRAAAMARERDAELLVIPMPEGRDPADIVAEGGREAFGALIDAALSVPEFRLRRVIATADGTTTGQDRAFEEALAIVAESKPGTALRGALMQQVQNHFPIDSSTLQTALQSQSPRAPDRPGAAPAPPPPAASSPIRAVERPELAFFALCVRHPEDGQGYLERLGDAHVSSPLMQRLRDHLRAHLRDPLAEIPDQDLGIRVNEVTLLADREPGSKESLKFSFLQLDLRRVERELRLAQERAEFERQRELWAIRENVRREIAELMGQTA